MAENYLLREACGITLDFTKQNISFQDFQSLVAHGKSVGLIEKYQIMCKGAVVNQSEGRAALHTALRDFRDHALHHAEVSEVQNKMFAFADAVRNGDWRGASHEMITDVINVGIGGSDIGPKAVWQALRPKKNAINLHFLSAADGVNFERITVNLNPFTTLVVVSSKSFKTVETLANTHAIDQWFSNAGIQGKDRNRHIVIASANPEATSQLQLPHANVFPFWEWVGGRFSVWGSVGLPLVIGLGSQVFQEFLRGAHAMDLHTSEASIDRNLPALIALLAFRNITEGQMPSYCWLPYDERLRGIVPWLQQLEMESLGKAALDDDHPTGARVWGGHGNEAQHSFYQWLRAGTGNTAIDICWCEKAGHDMKELHRLLINSAKAQVEALANRDNKNYQNAISTLCIDDLTPARLGALMAMYEHKTTMLGTLFGINPFDQPSVEFGKKLTLKLQTLQ